MGKGSNKGSGSYNWYGTWAGLVCARRSDYLYGLIADSRLIWPNARDYDASIAYPLNSLVRSLGRIWKWTNASPSTPGTAPPTADWVLYRVRRIDVGNPYHFSVEGYGDAYYYWGTSTQTLDAIGEATMSANGHPPFRNQSFIVLKNFLKGRERTAEPNIEVVWGAEPVQSVVSGNANDADQQANPLSALLDLAENSVTGPTISGLFDATTAQAKADELGGQSALTYISPIFNTAITFRDALKQFLQYYDGFVRPNSSGKYEFGRFSHGDAAPAFTAATTIDYNDVREEISIESGALIDTPNEVRVSFIDRLAAFKQGGVLAVMNWNRQLTGTPRSETVERPWIRRRDQAAKFAAEWGKIVSQPEMPGSIRVRAEKATSITVGALFLLTHDALGVSLICRCLSKTTPLKGEMVTIEYTRERGIAPVPYQPTAAANAAESLPDPEEITLYQFCQLPPAVTNGLDFQVNVLAARTVGTDIGLNVWFQKDDASDFEKLGQQQRWGITGEMHQDYDALTQVATASRARTSNVATIVTGSSHGLATGIWVSVLGLGGSGYNTSSAQITVVNATTFTYSNTGANEGTTADVNGTVSPLDDDDSEKFQVDLNGATLGTDIDRISEDQSDDMIANNRIVVIAFRGADPEDFEILTLKAIRLNSGVYKLKVVRAQFGTPRLDIGVGDPVWIIPRDSISTYKHERFKTLTEAEDSAMFRLQGFNYYRNADVSDTSVCPDVAYTFAPGYAPRVTWKVLQVNGGTFTPSGGTNYLVTDRFDFTFQIDDANGDLLDCSLVARRGSQARVLWSSPLTHGLYQVNVTGQFKIDVVGDWQVFAVVRDAAGRITEEELNDVGGSTKYPIHINVGGGTTIATPVAVPSSAFHQGNHFSVALSCSTGGVTIKWSLVSLHAAPGGYNNYSAPITVDLYHTIGKTLYAYATDGAGPLTDSEVVSWDFVPD